MEPIRKIWYSEKEDGDTLTDEIELKVQNTPKTVPLGKITIRKKIKEEDITWAHGNPTFFFVAEGKDLSGAFHRYEDYVTFAPESYQTDENGYAILSVTLDHVLWDSMKSGRNQCFVII